MQRSGAARSSTSSAPIAGTPEPSPAADAAQIRSVEAGVNAAVKSPDEDAMHAFATAYGAVDFVISEMDTSASGDDGASPPPGGIASTSEEMDGGTFPNARGGEPEIINDGHNMEAVSGMESTEGLEDAEAEGGIAYIDGDEAAARNLSQKLRQGMDIKELIAQLDSDGDGKVTIEDLQALMLKASVPLELLPPPTRNAGNNIELDQSDSGAVGTDSTKVEAAVRLAGSDIIALTPEKLSGSDDEVSADDGVTDSVINSSTSEWTKQRNARIPNDVEVGAMQVDEQAPQLNRRFYKGLNRPSRRAARKRRRRQGADNANAGGGALGGQGSDADTGQEHSTRRLSAILPDFLVTASVRAPTTRGLSNFSSGFLVTATLVEENEGEVVVAERVSFFERKWKGVALGIVIVLVILVVSLSVMLTNGDELAAPSLDVTSMSSPPSFDPTPTLEMVRSRGHVRCGMDEVQIELEKGLFVDLCRSIAAVLVGNPEGFEGVPVTTGNRWRHLQDRAVDVLVRGDTHTIEREVREVPANNPMPLKSSTGAGFTFSVPYNYAGMVYFGNKNFVECAEEQKRYGECSSLLICVQEPSTHYDFVRGSFPSDYYVVTTAGELQEVLFDNSNKSCNVATLDVSFILNNPTLSDRIKDNNYVVGTKPMTKEPLGIVTRNDDRQFSDIINWVLQALIYGEELGLTKNPTLCQNYTELSLFDVLDLDFMKAVHCVGNYGEIFGHGPEARALNQINNGTGMLYAIPFGDLDKDVNLSPDITLAKIRKEQSLACGIIVPDNFEGNVSKSDRVVGMGVEYCRALSAAFFTSDSERVNFTIFPESNDSSYVALANETIDVLVGGKVQRKYDFGVTPSLGGLHFSTPYYYGDEAANSDVSFYSIATREDDVLFASFVNCLVLATIYAQENAITREKSTEMPLVSVFGNKAYWALRDAIAYSGSYDEIYLKHFGAGRSEAARGRNILNKGGPLLLSFPGLRIDAGH